MSYTERYIFQSSLLIMTPHSFRLNAEGTGGEIIQWRPLPPPCSSNRAKKRSIGGRLSWQAIDVGMSQIGTDTSTCPKARWFDSFRGVPRAPGGTCFGASFFIFFLTRSSTRLEQWRSNKGLPCRHCVTVVSTPLFKGGVKKGGHLLPPPPRN